MSGGQCATRADLEPDTGRRCSSRSAAKARRGPGRCSVPRSTRGSCEAKVRQQTIEMKIEGYLLDSLVMHLRRLDVGGHGGCKEAELAHVRRGVDVDALREVVVRRVRGSEVRGQPTVHHGVDELCRLREEKLADVVDRETGLLHGVCDSHSLEVATVVGGAGLAIEERVIGGFAKVS